MYFLVLRQRADEVANLERELRELQITAEHLVQRREQTEKYLEDTEHRLKTRKDGTCSKTSIALICLVCAAGNFFGVFFFCAKAEPRSKQKTMGQGSKGRSQWGFNPKRFLKHRSPADRENDIPDSLTECEPVSECQIPIGWKDFTLPIIPYPIVFPFEKSHQKNC